MVPVRHLKRVNGRTVKCFYKSKNGVWKVLAIYRAKPRKFKLTV